MLNATIVAKFWHLLATSRVISCWCMKTDPWKLNASCARRFFLLAQRRGSTSILFTSLTSKFWTKEFIHIFFSDKLTSFRFRCTSCAKNFGSGNELKRHNLKHNPPTLKCPHCDVMKRSEDNLNDHIRTHTGEKPFQWVFTWWMYCKTYIMSLTHWISSSGVAFAKFTPPSRRPCSTVTRSPATRESGRMQKPRNWQSEQKEIKRLEDHQR